MQTSWAGLTTTNGLYICLADLLRYHHIDENFASRSNIYGLLTRCRTHREILSLAHTIHDIAVLMLGSQTNIILQHQILVAYLYPVCGFAGFQPDLPAQAAVCWSRTYFLSKIFLFGCNLYHFSASTKHE